MEFIDSHCHINFPEFKKDSDGIFQRMKKNSVTKALCVSVNLETVNEVISMAENNSNIFGSVGVHPTYTDCTEPSVNELIKLSNSKKVVAVGETGLDYFRFKGDMTNQQRRFTCHINAAKEISKPLIIHTRSAKFDTIKIMKNENAKSIGGVMHCFTETYEMAMDAIDMNFYISFSGIITFKNANEIREVVRKIPLSRILIETDSPYLAPVPHRGKQNEPSYVPLVAEEISKIKEIPISEVASETTNNFNNLFATDS